jgi:ABC-type branched-subunit amino acid transport system substrate-binding protein
MPIATDSKPNTTRSTRRWLQTLIELLAWCILGAALALCFESARAADGISETAIRLGMSSPMTGTAGAYGRQMRQGIAAYLAQVNAAGGVRGRRLELVSLDDGYESTAAAANTHQLIEQDKVFALIGFYGTASSQAVLPIIEASGVPLVGTVSGAEVLRRSDNHELFHLRASYGDEAAAIVRNLTTVGITRVAVLYQDDGFGRSGLEGVRRALSAHGLQVVADAAVPRNSIAVEPAVQVIAKSSPQAVVMVALARPAAAFVREMRGLGASPSFVALSPVGTDQLVVELGADGSRGIEVSQVIPNPRLDKVAVVREYKQALAAIDPTASASCYGLEGYLEAKLLVAGLRNAGTNPTRASFAAALHDHSFDLGGFRVQYGQPGNAGSNYVEISVVGPDGRILD